MSHSPCVAGVWGFCLQAETGDWKRFVVALTDGEDNRSRASVQETLKKFQSSAAMPVVLLIGVQLDDHLKPIMQELSTASEESMFIDANDQESLDEAFDQVAEMIAE